jgi:hypothetical protein
VGGQSPRATGSWSDREAGRGEQGDRGSGDRWRGVTVIWVWNEGLAAGALEITAWKDIKTSSGLV